MPLQVRLLSFSFAKELVEIKSPFIQKLQEFNELSNNTIITLHSDALISDNMARYFPYATLEKVELFMSDKALSDFQIKSLSIIPDDSETENSIYEFGLENFQYITVPALKTPITKKQYRYIADFVRNNDSRKNFEQAVESHLSDSIYGNLCVFLLDKSLIDCHADMFSNSVNEYTGADELKAFDDIIKENGGAAWYEFVSNKGTEEEVIQRAIIMNSDAEHYQKAAGEYGDDTVVIIDEDGDTIDLAYVNEIKHINRVLLY